jgi:branched-chain amino acid transport system substrate-binding protein
MEGFIFQFPDFDDAALSDPKINFQDSSGFYAEYSKRWPGEWGAVSWEYASILDLWRAGAEKAGSIEPTDVLAGMKAGGTGKHAFGEASWWGKELFGIDNALVGDWPVVVIVVGQELQDHDQALRGHGGDVLPARLSPRAEADFTGPMGCVA